MGGQRRRGDEERSPNTNQQKNQVTTDRNKPRTRMMTTRVNPAVRVRGHISACAANTASVGATTRTNPNTRTARIAGYGASVSVSVRRDVQVHAKGKGKKMNRQGSGMQRPEIGVPPIDAENEEFVLFARSKKSALKNWYPFTIMVGGSQANFLVKAQENELGKTLTGDTLAKSLGATLYKERTKVEDMVKERVPYLKVAKELEFGFKVRNKDKPASWMFTDGVSAIPAEEDCKGLIDKVNDWAAQFS